MPGRPYAVAADGVRLRLRVIPGAGTKRVDGVVTDAAGRSAVRLRVTAAPEKGRANAAVAKLLAKALKLPKSAISLTAGETSRNKTVLIAGPVTDLLPRLDAWLKTLAHE